MPIVTFYHDGQWWAEYDGSLGVITACADTEAEAVKRLEIELDRIKGKE